MVNKIFLAFFFSCPNSPILILHWMTWFVFYPGVERPAVVTKMNLTLSADHRVFDGKVGGTIFTFQYNICGSVWYECFGPPNAVQSHSPSLLARDVALWAINLANKVLHCGHSKLFRFVLSLLVLEVTLLWKIMT